MIAKDLIIDHDREYNPQYVDNYVHAHYIHILMCGSLFVNDAQNLQSTISDEIELLKNQFQLVERKTNSGFFPPNSIPMIIDLFI